jgi:hypothetical protein
VTFSQRRYSHAGDGDTAFNRLRDHVSLSNELFSDLVAALSAAEA